MIPVIDITPLRSRGELSEEPTLETIAEAALNFGAFIVRGHGLSPDLIEATYEESERFFRAPLADKMALYIGRNPQHRGYVPVEERGAYGDERYRSYESFDLGVDQPSADPHSRAAHRLLGPNIWPERPDFKAKVSAYLSAVTELSLTLCSALERVLALPSETFTGQMRCPTSQLRLLRYLDRAPEERAEVNMGAHTDYECLTIIHQRDLGLQVMDPHGEWVEAKAGPDELLILFGDLLEVWSNGLLKSTPHRVINAAGERSSLVYFAGLDYDTIVQPDPSLISEQRPAGYAAIHAGQHLERMLKRDFPYLAELDSAPERGEPDPIISPFEGRIKKREV